VDGDVGGPILHGVIHHAVPFQQGLAVKLGAHYEKFEVGLCGG